MLTATSACSDWFVRGNAWRSAQAAITKQEGVKTYPPGAVVTILNQMGGDTIVTTSQLPP